MSLNISSHSTYSSCIEGGWQPTCETLLEALYQTMAFFDEIFTKLVALDEYTDRPELLSGIDCIMSWKDIDLYLLVISRREQRYRRSVDLTQWRSSKSCASIAPWSAPTSACTFITVFELAMQHHEFCSGPYSLVLKNVTEQRPSWKVDEQGLIDSF